MNAAERVARTPGPPASPKVTTSTWRRSDTPRAVDGENGMLSLEAVALLPFLALLIVALLEVAGVIRDVVVVHEAARAGARAAATSTGTSAVVDAANAAAPELTLQVDVTPKVRRDGDIAHVEVSARRRVGPVTHTVRAHAVARVEPAVGTMTSRSPP